MKRIFTVAAVNRIRALAAEGIDPHVIAADIGCTIGSLIAMCSRCRISLAHPNRKRRRRPTSQTVMTMTATVPLGISPTAMARLEQEASSKGIATTKLAASLLEIIASDNLYDAVLDRETA